MEVPLAQRPHKNDICVVILEDGGGVSSIPVVRLAEVNESEVSEAFLFRVFIFGKKLTDT